MIKWDLILGCKDSSTYASQSMWHTTLTKWNMKNDVIISIDAKKIDKIQYHFMTKILNKVGIEGMHLNIIKAVYDKLTVNIILKGEKLKALPLWQEEIKVAHCCHFFNIVLEILLRAIRREKGINNIQVGKEEENLVLFVDNIILNIETPKESTKKLLVLINNFRISFRKQYQYIKISCDSPSWESNGIKTAEQSLTGRHWNSPKRYPISKDKGEATMRQ